MNARHIVLTALTAALATTTAVQASTPEKAKEKCYGVVHAGHNDCANLSGSHSCAGQSKTDKAPDEWKYVAKGTCKADGGLTAEEAKAQLDANAKTK